MSSSAPKSKSCPLGHVCEACLWQIEITRVNDMTGDQKTFSTCAVRELPLLLEQTWREQNRTTRGVEDFRDRMVTGNERFLGFLQQAALNHDQG